MTPAPLEHSRIRANRGLPAAGWAQIPALAAEPAADPLRKAALVVGIALIFLRFSMLHQLQAGLMGVNLYLLYVVGIPALLGVVAAGGIPRAYQGRPTVYWTGFAVWAAMGIPFSYWRTSSVMTYATYLRTELIMLFVFAGLLVTWRECKTVLWTIAWAAVVNLLAARVFSAEVGGRMALAFGTVSNPNDFAGHLLLVGPFLIWVALAAKTMPVRLAALAGAGFAVQFILRTGSRGALVALGAEAAFFLWRGTLQQRMALVVLGPIVALALLATVPQTTLRRITSFGASAASDPEAIESSALRTYLVRKSIEYTIKFPVFGVGFSQFTLYEGTNNVVVGTHGAWRGAHNSFTAVSSECGIPALLFYLAAVISSFRLLNRTYRKAKCRTDAGDVRIAAFCVMMGMTGFTVSIAFLNFSYFFYLPAMGGLAVAMARAAEARFAAADADAARLAVPAARMA